MLNKIDMLIWNLIAIVLFMVVIYLQYTETVTYVDTIGNLFSQVYK